MGTVVLNRTPAMFWKMTMRELVSLIMEYTRIESLKGKADATRTGYSVACYQHGIIPFADEEKPVERELTPDEAFDLL